MRRALAASASGLAPRVDVVGVVGAARLDDASTSGTVAMRDRNSRNTINTSYTHDPFRRKGSSTEPSSEPLGAWTAAATQRVPATQRALPGVPESVATTGVV